RAEPAHITHLDRVVEPELLAQVRAHLGRDVRVGGELLERIAGGEREHREEHHADPDQARDRDEQAADEIPTHLAFSTSEIGLRPRSGSGSVPESSGGQTSARYQSCRFQKSRSQPLICARSLVEIAATRGRATTGITTRFSITRSFMRMKSAARFTGSSSFCADL